MRQPGWREATPGGVVSDAGNSVQTDTGSWRLERPVVDWDECTHCLICWAFCPDSCLEVRGGRLIAVDYDHCKGCGICAEECPRHCIAMLPEAGLVKVASDGEKP